MMKRNVLVAGFLAVLLLSLAQAELDFPPIGEAGSQMRYPGKVVWHDLFPATPDKAAAFYSGVFGWEAETHELNDRKVILMRSGGYPVAAIVERPKVDGEQDGGIWVAYASVESVDESMSAVIAAGGRILVEKGTIPGRGEHAICMDSQGAIFGLLRTESGDPGEYFPGVGQFIWSQQLSRNPQAVREFYEAISHYTIIEDDRFGDAPVYFLSSGGFARAGIAPFPAESGSDKADWIHFIRVESITAALEGLAATEASVVVEPNESMLNGRIALITDPSGAILGLMEADSPASKEEVAQ